MKVVPTASCGRINAEKSIGIVNLPCLSHEMQISYLITKHLLENGKGLFVFSIQIGWGVILEPLFIKGERRSLKGIVQKLSQQRKCHSLCLSKFEQTPERAQIFF